jgi:hypothetical protein
MLKEKFIKQKTVAEVEPYDLSELSKEMLHRCKVIRRKNINLFRTREELAKEYKLSII